MKKWDQSIPYIFPTDYHMAPYQEMIGYESYVNYIGVMRDAIEKADIKEEDLY